MAGGDQSFCQRPPNILSARPRKTCSGQRAATQWFFGSNSVCTKRPICRLIRVELLPRAGQLSMSERRLKRGKEKGQVLVLVTLVSIPLFAMIGLVVDLGWMRFLKKSKVHHQANHGEE